MPRKEYEGPFWKIYPIKWNEGTDAIDLELEGALLRICNAINLTEMAVRDNLFVLNGLWRCNSRKSKRLRQQLIDAGKITIKGGRIENARAMKTVSSRRKAPVDGALTDNSPAVHEPNHPDKALKNKDTAPGKVPPKNRVEENRIEKNPSQSEVEATSHLAGVNVNMVLSVTTAAAGACLDPEAEGLKDASPLMRQIANGASLALDVIPAIKSRAPTLPEKSIRSWKYFEGIIAEWMQIRSTGGTPPRTARFGIIERDKANVIEDKV
ncbi:MAG: hypothetical protein GY952_13905 [Rhodobacteraceae bacterium]|nr:hypothetical protein [Paracoccaceae bacterium]